MPSETSKATSFVGPVGVSTLQRAGCCAPNVAWLAKKTAATSRDIRSAKSERMRESAAQRASGKVLAPDTLKAAKARPGPPFIVERVARRSPLA
ncbi:MAG: hypothetical protein U0163_18140 [Gemmatimonadaceae bacterium]